MCFPGAVFLRWLINCLLLMFPHTTATPPHLCLLIVSRVSTPILPPSCFFTATLHMCCLNIACVSSPLPRVSSPHRLSSPHQVYNLLHLYNTLLDSLQVLSHQLLLAFKPVRTNNPDITEVDLLGVSSAQQSPHPPCRQSYPLKGLLITCRLPLVFSIPMYLHS